jgi:hypothetical protein
VALLILGEAAGRTSGMTLPSASGRSGRISGKNSMSSYFLYNNSGDMMKINYYLLTKMTIGFIMGFLIAEAFSLDYVYTAGVIAVLSLEPTRKRSIEIGFIRIIDSLIALSLAYLIFYFMGFSIWSLFVFIALFIPLM